MSNSRPSFPSVIDSSMRGEFVACPQAFKNNYISHLRKKGRSIHLHFGGVFADGLAEWRRQIWDNGLSCDNALLAAARVMTAKWADYPDPDNSPKTFERCLGALEAYANQYPPGTDHVTPFTGEGQGLDVKLPAAVEFNFAWPLPIPHPETGEPILYSGRFDQLASMGQSLFVEDDKTTSQLGPSWSNNWKLRAQFTGYVWGARKFGYNVQGAIVRGISILKSGYGHAEVIEARPQWMIDRWEAQLLRDINRMIDCWRTDQWDFNLDSACSAYGGCQYLNLCTSEHPARWIEAEYEIHHYDPLAAEQL